MSNRNGRSNGHNNDDTIRNAIAAAFSSATQQQSLGSNQAPQNSPMNAGTPRDGTPRDSTPVNDAQFCRYGKVVEYWGDSWVDRPDERVVIKFKDGEPLVLTGQQAFDARMEVVEWDEDLEVQVIYAGPGVVSKVKRFNGVMIPGRIS